MLNTTREEATSVLLLILFAMLLRPGPEEYFQ